MADDTLRAAVIGGGLGAYHAYAYAGSPRYDLAAVCDIDPDVIPRFYERSGIPSGSIAEYTDYRLMLEREKLDVVSVATPGPPARRRRLRRLGGRRPGDPLREAPGHDPGGRRPHDRRRGGQRHLPLRRPHPQLDPALPADAAGGARRRPGPPDPHPRPHGGPAVDAVPQRHPPRGRGLLLRRGGSRLGDRRPRTRLRGVRAGVRRQGGPGPAVRPRLHDHRRVRQRRPRPDQQRQADAPALRVRPPGAGGPHRRQRPALPGLDHLRVPGEPWSRSPRRPARPTRTPSGPP